MERGNVNKNIVSNHDVTWQLLQPELLSIDTLTKLLNERCIQIPKEIEKNKDQLVEMYGRVILPLPQRRLPTKTPSHRNAALKRTRVNASDQATAKLARKSTPIPTESKSDTEVRNGNHHVRDGSQDLQNGSAAVAQTKVHQKITLKRRAWSSPSDSSESCAPREEVGATQTTSLSLKTSIAKALDERSENEALSPAAKKQRTAITWP